MSVTPNFRTPMQARINPGANTPNPGGAAAFGTVVHNPELGMYLMWLGADWQPYAGGLAPDQAVQAHSGVSATLTQVWGPFTVSGVVKGVAGDPGAVLALFCVSASTGKVSLWNGATSSTTLLDPSASYVWGGGGASGKAMVAGQYVTLGAEVDSPNGIYIEIVGTGSYMVVGQ